MTDTPEDPEHESATSRSVREVVDRTRDMLRKTREMLDTSRDLLDKVRRRDGDKDPGGGPPAA